MLQNKVFGNIKLGAYDENPIYTYSEIPRGRNTALDVFGNEMKQFKNEKKNEKEKRDRPICIIIRK